MTEGATPPTPKRKRTCSVARYWGHDRQAWRCNLESKHEGKHFDPVRQMYWGDVLAMQGRTRP